MARRDENAAPPWGRKGNESTEYGVIGQSINQSIKTHLYSAKCRERIRGT